MSIIVILICLINKRKYAAIAELATLEIVR
jgi:hypothetical protein